MALGWAVTFITLALAVVIGFDRFTGEEYLENDIKVITESAGVEEFLNKYKDAIGKDLPGYRNHIYRVLSYTMHFLQNDKTAQTHYRLIEAALVFHDIGLWTDHELAYLEPSTILARRQLSGATKEELELVHNMIYWHHKLTPFEGPHANIVNAVRKADWIDASLGLVTKGVLFAFLQIE